MNGVLQKNEYLGMQTSQEFAQYTPAEALKALRTFKNGLSEDEVKKRQRYFGANKIRRKRRFIWLGRILSQVKNPVAFILLVSGVLLWSLGLFVDAYVVLAVFFVNLFVALLQERKVSNAFELLRSVEKLYADVIRNGQKVRILAEELVPGDIVEISAGVKLPADMRILWENELQIDEAILTGEWAPVQKQAITLSVDRPLSEQINMGWKDTVVVTGTGRGVVTKTGGNTAVGKIARELGDERVKTPLQLQTEHLARWIMLLVLLSSFAVVGIALFRDISLVDSIITAVAIGIAGIPSGLPVAITVVLVVGMQTVLKKNGLVRNLLAAETLGGTTWILTDKTGTLTDGKMTFSEIITPSGREHVSDKTMSPKGRAIVQATYHTTDGNRIQHKEGKSTLTGSFIERAVVVACEEVCETTPSRSERVYYNPFDSKEKYSAALMRMQSGVYHYHIVGAPEVLLEKASHIFDGTKTTLLTTKQRQALEETLVREAGEGKRVLAIGTSVVQNEEVGEKTTNEIAEVLKDCEMAFVAFLVLEDEVHDGAAEAIENIRNAYVHITMVTGDNQHTAVHVAKETGIIREGESEKVLLGDAMKDLSDEEIFEKAQTIKVFARMLPEQKSRLLRVLLGREEVVAMTGDGVNDAPALHNASIGIAVASGTDVAKEASDLILLKNSFSTITAAIVEGKKITGNLKKIIIYLLSTSFSEAFLVAGGLLIVGTLPILPAQILWANIVEEAFIAFAFAFEGGDGSATRYTPRNKEATNIISAAVRKTIFILTLVTGTFLLATFFFLSHFSPLTEEQIQTVMFIAVSVDSIFLAFALKRLNQSIFTTNIFENRWLIGAVVISIVLLVVVFVTPFLSGVLHLTAIPLWTLWIIPISALFHITVIEMIKVLLFKEEYASPHQGILQSGTKG